MTTEEDWEAEIAKLDKLVLALNARMDAEEPPVLRQYRSWTLDYADALRVPLRERDIEAIESLRSKERRTLPRALQGTEKLIRAEPYVIVDRSIAPWRVLIEWSALPAADDDLRKDVESLASMWRDFVNRRPVGRPRKGDPL